MDLKPKVDYESEFGYRNSSNPSTDDNSLQRDYTQQYRTMEKSQSYIDYRKDPARSSMGGYSANTFDNRGEHIDYIPRESYQYLNREEVKKSESINRAEYIPRDFKTSTNQMSKSVNFDKEDYSKKFPSQ